MGRWDGGWELGEGGYELGEGSREQEANQLEQTISVELCGFSVEFNSFSVFEFTVIGINCKSFPVRSLTMADHFSFKIKA